MITQTWQMIDLIADRLEAQSGPLGIKYVGKYDEGIIPEYPAVVVLPGPRAKTLHATRTFQVAFEIEMYVYHANLTLTKRERSKADLQLVSRWKQTTDGWTPIMEKLVSSTVTFLKKIQDYFNRKLGRVE